MNRLRLRFAVLLHAAAATLLLYTAAATAADLTLDDCVHLPDPESARSKVAAVAVGSSVDIGNLSVIELDGDYARGLDAPRMAVAQRFYETHADRYDFIVTFTTFEFETGDALAFYSSLRNDVQGIGSPVLDLGSHYGSAAKLQGYIDMAAISRYTDVPGDPRIGRNAHSTLAHEIMHRWGARVSYRTEAGATSPALLGLEGSHWSYFLDTDASIMLGADWVRRGDGRFQSTAIRYRYSPLDLYLAGFASAAEVPPMQLIVGGDGTATDLPRLGAISGGSAETVRIEQIIAAEGPRIPDAAHAPKDFRAALILLKRPGENVAPATLAALEGVRVRLQQYFSQITDGRASLRIYNEPMPPSATPQLPVILSGSGTAATTPGIAAAVAWIQQRQHPDGHWQDRAATALRDTAVVVQLLQQADPAWPGLTDARAWLAAQTPANRDGQSWKLALDTTAPTSTLIDAQSATGGWGLVAGFEDSTLDTALVADALARRDADATAVQRALTQLAARQNGDGSFALAARGRGRMLPTLRAARLFASATQPAHQSVRDAAAQWLASRQRADGSFGDAGAALADSTLADTIELYGLVGRLPLPGATATTARDFVIGAQQTAGDWQGSIYLTATAALAQLYDNKANLAAGGAASVMPADAVDGDVLTLQLRVVNAGSRAAAASIARWYDGDPATGGSTIGADQPLPALAAGAATMLQQRWDSAGQAGTRTLWLVLDVQDTVAEQNEADNRIAIPVTVGSAPAQADIALDPTLFTLTPPAVASLPATIRVSGSVRNLGNTPVAAARLVLYDDAEPPRVLTAATLALPARGSAPLDLEFTATAAATLRLRLVADPDGTVAEARENNNEARLLLPFGPSLDLEVRDTDLTLLDTTPPTQGRDVGFRVQLRNRGTLTASNAALRITLQQGAGEETLFDGRVTLEPGQTIERRHYWRAREAGAATLRVQLDAVGEIAELDESNNLAQWPFTIAAASGSDLVAIADSLQFTPEPALQGKPLQASLRVRNDGAGTSGAFTVALFANDPRSGGTRLAQSLIPGLAAQTETGVIVNVADLGLAGDTPVFVAVDADQQIVESDEANNLALHTLNVLPLADIAVASAAMQLVPSAPAPGAPQQVSAVVRNLGAQAAQNIIVRLFEGNPETGAAIGTDQVITELAAGAETTLTWNWIFGLQPGARQLSLIADPAGSLRENQTLNNLAILPLALQDAAFYASERYISPNGDGVRDATALFFARAAAGRIDVVVRNTAGRVVRRFDDLAAADATSGQIVWDGRDGRDRVVADGVYVAEQQTAGQATAELAVTVDTDRSSLIPAIDTPLLADQPLPEGSWLQPPATAATRETLFARARSDDPHEAHYGIYRTNTIVPERAAVVSPRWLRQFVGSDDGGSDPISARQFSPDGQWIAFYIRRGNEFALAIAATAQRDHVIVLDTDAVPAARTYWRQPPLFLDANRVLAGAFPQLHIYDLQTRAKTPLRTLPNDSGALRAYAHGLYIWRAQDGEGVPPAYYVPHDTQRAIVVLPRAQDGEQMSVRINADGTRAVIRRYAPTHESLELFRAETGAQSPLQQRIPEAHAFPSLSEPGHLPTLQAQWITADDSLLLVDAATRRVQILDRDGAVLSSAQLPPADDALDLGPDPARFDGGHRRTGTLYVGDGCNSTRTDCAGAAWSTTDRRRQWFDPAARRAVVLLASSHIGPVTCEVGRCFEHAPATLEAFAIDVDDGHHERLAATQNAARLPADVQPRLRLADGSVFATDSRYGTAGNLSDQPWRYSDAITNPAPAFSGDDASLIVGPSAQPRAVTALVNLSAQLWAEPTDRAVRLSGIAADINFAYYVLDWALPSAPTQWHAITPPQNEAVFGDEFLSWIPPQPGQYLVRLRVVDKAGNATVRIAPALSSSGSPVFELSLDSRYFSPNGDGVKDAATVSFRLAATTQTDVRIRDALGVVVRERNSVLAAGPQQFVWDGRNDAGQLLADGDYVVDVAGQTLKLALDTTPPVLTAQLVQPNLPFSDGDVLGHTNRLYIEGAATDRHPDGIRYELRALDGGGWREAPLDAYGNLIQNSYRGLAGKEIRATAYDRAGNHSLRELGAVIEQLLFADCDIQDITCSARHTYPAPAIGPVNYPADFPEAVDLVIADPLNVELWLQDGSTGFAAIDIEIADTRHPGEWSVFATLPGTRPPFEFDHRDRGIRLQLPWSSLPQGADRRLRAVGIRADGSRLPGDQLRAQSSGLGVPLVFCPGHDPGTAESPEVRELLSLRPYEVQVVVPVFYDGIADEVELLLGTDEQAINSGTYRSMRATAHNARHAYFRFPSAGVGAVRARLVNSAGLATATRARGVSCNLPPPSQLDETMELRANPVFGERCAGLPTQQWHFVAERGMVMQHYGLALEGSGGRHVLLDETPARNDATAGSGFPWIRDVNIPTAAIPEGRYLAVGIATAGTRSARGIATVEIDHDPAQAELVWPSSGSRVCAARDAEGFPALRIGTALRSDSAVGYQLSLKSATSDTDAVCPDRSGWLSRDECLRWNAGQEPAQVRELRGRGPAVTGLNGRIEAELAVGNASGAIVCSTTSFDLDSIAELGIGGAAEPSVGVFQLRTPDVTGEYDAEPRVPLLGLSVNGAPRYRNATIPLIAREPLSYRASLHALVAISSGGSIDYELGSELASLAETQNISGAFQVSWNGQVNSNPVADGHYAIRIAAEDACGWTATRYYVIAVDSTPPTLAITAPAPGAVPTDAVVAISGSVDDARFGSFATAQPYWQLLVEQTGSSQLIAEDEIAVPQPAVLGRWSRGAAQGAGRYVLRAVDDFGNTAEIGQPFGAPVPLAVLRDAQALPELFSPNGDGRLDQTQLRLQLLVPARVDVRVRDAGGAVVAELAQNLAMAAGTHTIDWSGGGLPDGRYAVEIAARNAAQPDIAENAALALEIDTTAPQVADVTPANAYANGGETVSFRIVEPRLDRFDARLTALDGGAIVAQLGGAGSGAQVLAALDGLAERDYRLSVLAQDRAGNHYEHVHVFTFDATAPEAALTAPLRDSVLPRGGAAVAITGSAHDAHVADYRVELLRPGEDSGELIVSGATDVVGAALGSWNVTQADGDYRLRLRVRDRAGNAAEAAQPLAIDGTPPVVTLAAPAAGAALAGHLTLRGSVLDAHLRDYRVAIATPSQALSDHWTPLYRGEAPVSDGVLAELDLTLPEGDYLLRVLATDATGAAATVTRELRLDRSAPAAPLQLRARLDGADAVLDWSPPPDGDLAGYAIYRNGARLDAALVVPPHRVDAALADGRWRYEVSAIDRAGNESARSNRVELALDRTPPQVGIDAPLAASRVHGVVTVVGTAFSADDFDSYVLTARRSDGSDAAVTLAQGSLPQRNQVLAHWNTLVHAEEAAVTVRLAARDRSGNEAVSEIALVVDNLAPAAPQGLVATVQGVDGAIAWTANTEPDLLGYLLYRNGRLVNATAQLPEDLRGFALTAANYLDTALPDGTHRYVVFAIDRAGNLSAASNDAAIGPIDNGPPHLLIDAPENDTAFETSIDLRASSRDGDIASVQFAWRAAGASGWTALGAGLSEAPYRLRWTPGNLPHGDYEIRALARDTAGLDDPQPPQVRVRYADLTAPAGPGALLATADGGTVQLSWAASTGPDAVAYRVERFDGSDWQRVGDDAAGTTRSDSGRDDGHWTYRVSALDAAGNRSDARSDDADVFSLTFGQPFTPTTQATTALQGRSALSGRLHLRVGAGTELDAGPTGAGGGFALDAVALEPGANLIALHAVSAGGDRSRRATRQVVRAAVPAAPTGVQASAAGYDVSVHWNANTEADVIGYRIEHNGGYAHADDTLVPVSATSAACCEAGNSIDGNPATQWDIWAWFDPLASDAPSDPMLELDLGAAQIVSAVELDWRDSATASGNIDVYAHAGDDGWVRVAQQRLAASASMTVALSAAYRSDKLRLVLRSPLAAGGSANLALAEVRVRAWHLAGTTAFEQTVLDGQHRYRVAAVNASALQSAWSADATIGIGDTTPPDPVVLDGTLSGNTATLTWSASVAPDVARYVLSRGDHALADIAANAERRHVDANLALGDHAYTVVALDAFGNASAASNRVILQVGGSGPGVPQALAVVAPPQGASLQLSWNAGDGSAAVHYLVRRATSAEGPFAQIASVTATTFADTPLSDGTRYHYTVEAVDSAGNRSGASTPASGVPRDTLAPAAPVLSYPVAGGGRAAIDGDHSLVCGRAEAGSIVEVRRDATLLAATTAAAQLQRGEYPADGNGIYSALTLAGDGWHLANTDNGLRITDLRDGQIEILAVAARLAQWSAHAETLYYIVDERLQTKRPGRPPQPLPVATEAIHSYAVSADESHVLLYGRRTGDTADTLWWLSRDGTTARRIAGLADYPVDPNAALWLRADARYAALATTDGRLVVVDLDAARVLDAFAADAYIRPSWSPDGVLGFTRPDAGTPTLWTYDAVTRRADLRFAPPSMQAFAWSPDGSEFALLLSGGHIEVRSTADGSLRFDAATNVYDFNASTFGWAASARIVLLGTTDMGLVRLYSLQPPGAFCAGPVALRAGTNRIDAVATDAAGNRGGASLAQQIDVDAAALPDLALSANDVFFVPATPAPGQRASALVTVRNRGGADVAGVTLAASLRAPDGSLLPVAAAAPFALAAGASRSQSVDLGVLAHSGHYRLRLVADPDALITERDETNNSADTVLAVSDGAAPLLDVALAGTLLAPGTLLTGEVRVTAPGAAFDGRVHTRIVASDSTSVADLGETPIAEIAAGQTWTHSVAWNSAGVLAGDYRLRARLLRRDGSTVAERDAAFAIEAVRRIDLAVAALPSQQPAGTNVAIESRLYFSAGNALLAGATLRVSAHAESGAEVWAATQPLGTLQPGYELHKTDRWDTRNMPPGVYTLRLHLAAPGYDAATESSLRLVEAGTYPPLAGALTLTPDGRVVAGRGDTLTYRVTNAGAALTGLQLRLRVLRTPTLANAFEREETVALAAGASLEQTIELGVPPLALGSYIAVLDAHLPGDTAGSWRDLARLGFAALDEQAPAIVIQSPVPDSLQPALVNLRVLIADAHSDVIQAHARIDDGGWQPLSLDTAGRWSLPVSGLADGAHRVTVRARDRWNNESTSASTAFAVDATAPLVTISGIAEGALTNQVTTPTVTIADAHLDSPRTSVLLNGASYVSGTPVSADGSYTLAVQARDTAGNETLASLHFTLDRTPPALAITSPADASVLAASAVDVTIDSEAGARVALQVGAFSAEQLADAAGHAVFAAVALVEGDNPIDASATDRAGNTSPTRRVTVRYEASTAQPLVGTVQPGQAELAHGTPLQVALQLRNPGAVALPEQSIRLRVIASGGSVLAQQDYARAFAASETFADTPEFATAAWPLGSVELRLEILREGQWIALDTQSVQIVDRTPPLLQAVTPQAGAVAAAPLRLRAQASDALSAPVTVDASLDAGVWNALASSGGDAFESTALKLADGAHSYRLRARDAAGNETPLAAITFTVDSLAPQITITGIADGDLVNHTVTPQIDVSDAHPATTTLRLNGQPYASGSAIAASGSYLLRVDADDTAGNRATRDVAFTIDLEAPGVVVDTPLPGSTVTAAAQEIAGRTEPHADVAVQAPGLDTVVRADANGLFRTAAATLAPGANALHLRATDRAGNIGDAVTVTVSYVPAAGEALAALFLDASTSVRRGDPLSLRYTLRNPGTLALDATPVRVQLRSADGGALITQDSYAVSLAVDAEITRSSTFATGTLATGGYRVSIAAELRDAGGQSAWTELAALDVLVRQGCPAGRPIDLLFRNNFDGDLDDPLFCGDFEASSGKHHAASSGWLPPLLFAPARLPGLGTDAATDGDSR